MSRYYSVEIEGGATYTSLVGGQTDPNALNVELDISVVGAATPVGGAYVRVWGVGLKAISQSRDLWNKKITVRGGMAKGLPLANPAQAGVLASGLITKAFGNWIMTDQTLDIIFSASAATNGTGGVNPKHPNNHLVLNWKKGQALGPALQQALTTAFPGVKIALNIAKNVVAPQDQPGFFANLQQLAFYVGRMSQQIVGGSYQGVSIVHTGSQITVADQGQSGVGTLSYTDLVGQPTWIGPQTIQFKTIMRADLNVLDKITMPKTWINSSSEGAATAGTNMQAVAFQGQFQIVSMRHVGNFRQPSGDAWCTIFEATSQS